VESLGSHSLAFDLTTLSGMNGDGFVVLGFIGIFTRAIGETIGNGQYHRFEK
jgi:hypothetical protein